MEIIYLPNIGIEINNVKISWEDNRDLIRTKLLNTHRVEDSFIDNSDFFDGDKSYDINIKRDVYENIYSSKNLLFLNYDINNKFTEIEFHIGAKVKIEEIEFNFGDEILKVVKKINSNYILESKGNYIFTDLKMNIASDKYMGGNGNGLSYFYASNNINHLLEDI